MGMKPGPFKNEFGIQTNQGVRKPVYRLFEALHAAGDLRLDVQTDSPNVEGLALTDGNDTLLVIYNHDLDRRTVKAEQVELTIKGEAACVRCAVIDEDHCNLVKAWQDMGSPAYLKADQVAALHRASELEYQMLPDVKGETSLSFTAAPESVAFLWMRNR